jgi:putative PEP-CTERM system TPR-repeat lipoprotein
LLPPALPEHAPVRWKLALGLCALLAIVVFAAMMAARSNQRSPSELIAEAKRHAEKGEIDAAQLQLRNALQIAPDNAEARLALGNLYLDSGKWEAAEAEFRKAIEHKHDLPVAVAALAKALVNQGKYQEVLDETTAERLSEVPASPVILAIRGRAELGLRRSEQARASFEQALGLDPDNPDALLGMAKLLVLDKEPKRALELTERALLKAPSDLDTLLMKADLQSVLGDDKSASSTYQEAIKRHPKDPRSRLSLAAIQIGRGQFDDAVANIKAVLNNVPDSPTANYLLALIEFRRGNKAAAQQHAADVLKVQPTHAPSALLAGASEYAVGDLQRAEMHLKWVLDRAPRNLYARKLYAATLGRKNQPRLAIEVLAPALKQSPDDPELLALAGELHLQARLYSQAQELLARAASLQPRDAGRRIGLGVSRLAAGELDQAVSDLEAAVSLAPDDAEPRILLATAELGRGNFERALAITQPLKKSHRQNAAIHNLIGSAYVGMHKWPEARSEFEKALALDPSFTAAVMNLAQLEVREKRPEAARKRLEAFVERGRDEVGPMLALADLLAAAPGERAEADRLIERAASIETRGVSTPQIIDHYLRAYDFDKAVTLAQRAVQRDSENVELLELLARTYFAAGNIDSAVGVYGRIVQLQPKSVNALYGLAWLQSETGKQAAARLTLGRALALDPAHADSLALQAALESRSGDKAEAMRSAKKLQALHPKSHAGHVLAGDIYMADRRFEDATKEYLRAKALAPTRLVANRLYDSFLGAGRISDAEDAMLAWLQKNPSDIVARQEFADASMRAGRLKTAVTQYELVVKARPRSQQALNNLAWAYFETGDARAQATAQKAYDLNPRNAAVADTLGVILLQQGKTERALQLLRAAAEDTPEMPDIRYHYAMALARSGDRKAARTELQKALAGNRPFDRAEDARKLLAELQK